MLFVRAIAAVVALASLLPALVGLAWASFVFMLVAHGPDRVGDGQGDACCDYADNWSELAAGVAWGLLLAALSVAVLYVATTLAQFAIKGERPKLLRLRRLITTLGAFGACAAVLFVI